MHACHACMSCMHAMHACHAYMSCMHVMHACHACMSCMHVMHACHACMPCMHVMHACHACMSCMHVMHACQFTTQKTKKDRVQKVSPGGAKTNESFWKSQNDVKKTILRFPSFSFTIALVVERKKLSPEARKQTRASESLNMTSKKKYGCQAPEAILIATEHLR